MVSGLETFAKVRALHDRTDNPCEKAAAAGRMEVLARAAGMTVNQAKSKLDTPDPTIVASATFEDAAGFAGAFNDFFNTPFFRQAKADGDRRRAEQWRRVLEEYGSEEAVFAPCAWEQALERACDPFIVRKVTTGWPMGSLWGWAFVTSRGDPAPQIVDAIANAYPMPTTVRQAWVEFAFWDKLGRDREARGTACGDHRDWVYLRVQMVERRLNTLPAAGLSDLRARMDWMDWRNDLESAPDPAEERIRLATLRADIERMGARLREQDIQTAQDGQPPHLAGSFTSKSQNSRPGCDGVQDGQQQGPAPDAYPSRRTNAEKRRDVLALLAAAESGTQLTDREIARRAGVSPQTVGNIRRGL